MTSIGSASLIALARLTIAAVATALLGASAWAGEFFENDGAALRGYDPVAYVA